MKSIKILIILILIKILTLTSCQIQFDFNEELDKLYRAKIQKQDLYYLPEFSEIKTHLEIASWIRQNIEYKADIIGEDIWSTAKETIEMGYGDCEDIAQAYMNIAYFALGIEMDFSLIDFSQRMVIEGGSVNHAEVQYQGYNYDPRVGIKYEETIEGFLYDFYEFFNK